MTYRLAILDDCTLLGRLNQQLIQDEGHRNPMTASELEARMRSWLPGEYRGVLFEERGELAAYAIFRERAGEVYLRQFFVVRDRRGEGLGRQALEILRSEVWPATKRLTVDVLVSNQRALAFWRAAGYRKYAVTLEIPPHSCRRSGSAGL
jgi:GNAT superfamily N-acetyltransferase